MNQLKNAFIGLITAYIASFVAAILFAYIFRFPIPFSGYIGPFGELSSYSTDFIETIKSVLIAWWFYGILGGYIILGLGGIGTGLYIGHKYADATNKNRFILFWSAVLSAIPVFILAILDFLIGPW